jgi:hypothetical protein
LSYLDPPRLHFSGKFLAAISTVNNDPAHFDNATFQPQYQELQSGNAPAQWNGWFSPRGDADWRLIGCTVTSAVGADGPVSSDPVLGCVVADSDRLPPAKLVDLDTEQQLVSEIWGLEIRIHDARGVNLLRGGFDPAGFMDIWTRSVGSGGGDNSAAAMYQSTLSGLEWGDVSESPLLGALQKASAATGLLSVKFNLDGVNLNFGDPEFLRGRIAGTIGAAAPGEPAHFVRGRQFMATAVAVGGGFPSPMGGLNNCVGSVDAAAPAIHLDLGNALPTTVPGGPIEDLGELQLAYFDPTVQKPAALAGIPYQDPSWYERTAGVLTLPLTTDQLSDIAGTPLLIMKPVPAGAAVAISEAPNGLHVRADEFVYRLDPGATATVKVYASTYGQPYPQARIKVIHDPYQLQAAPFGNAPPPGVPEGAVDFPAEIVADATGVAWLPIYSRDPGNPRDFIDGQVYGIRPMLAETVAPGAIYPFNMWEFVSVLVYDAFVPDDPPTWWGSLQPIFQQYANLYPIMGDFVDLAAYEDVCRMREMMLLAFEQSTRSPNSMPVTRDLSTAKRAAILKWLRDVGPDGKPLLGPVPSPAAAAAPAATAPAPPAAAAPAPDSAPPPVDPSQGGKAVAMARRLAFLGPNAGGS